MKRWKLTVAVLLNALHSFDFWLFIGFWAAVLALAAVAIRQ